MYRERFAKLFVRLLEHEQFSDKLEELNCVIERTYTGRGILTYTFPYTVRVL